MDTLRWFVHGAYRVLRSAVESRLPQPLLQILKYYSAFHKIPNLRSPRTFHEKVLYKSIFDRRRMAMVFEDKFLQRAFVENRLGTADNLIEWYGVYDTPSAIRMDDFPDEFVLKSTQGSGLVKIYRKHTPRNLQDLRSQARSFLDERRYRGTGEWCYRKVKPKIIAERLLLRDDKVPADYKFYCFDGKPKLVLVYTGRFDEPRESLFDVDWKRISCQWGDVKQAETTEPAPLNFGGMCEIAEKLSAGIDFIRIDLYNLDGRIYFGEFCPGPGFAPLTPLSLDEEFGGLWRAPDRYR